MLPKKKLYILKRIWERFYIFYHIWITNKLTVITPFCFLYQVITTVYLIWNLWCKIFRMSIYFEHFLLDIYIFEFNSLSCTITFSFLVKAITFTYITNKCLFLERLNHPISIDSMQRRKMFIALIVIEHNVFQNDTQTDKV